MKKTKIIGAIEIGTDSIKVLIGEIQDARSLKLLGFGQATSIGVVKGDIQDYKSTGNAVHAAIKGAEDSAGVKLDQVILSCGGTHIKGFSKSASISVGKEHGVVRPSDVQRVMEMAREVSLPEERSSIQDLRRGYHLDGRRVLRPVGMEGSHLEVSYWIAHGSTASMSDCVHIINGFEIKVEELFLAATCSGLIATTREERERGVLCLDIGRGTTDFAYYLDGHCHMAGSLPLGGDHLTNDLAQAFHVKPIHAENLKIRHANALVQARDRHRHVWLYGDISIGDKEISLQQLETVTALRLREIFEVVQDQVVMEMGPGFSLGGGVVLVGGSSHIQNIVELAADVFGCQARQGGNPSWVVQELQGPEYCTVLGLLQHALLHYQDSPVKSPGIFERLKDLFAVTRT